GREDSSYGEVPAVYVKKPVLGFSITLSGYQDEQQYLLKIGPKSTSLPLKFENPEGDPRRFPALEPVNISEHVCHLLSTIEGISVSPVVPTASAGDVATIFGP